MAIRTIEIFYATLVLELLRGWGKGVGSLNLLAISTWDGTIPRREGGSRRLDEGISRRPLFLIWYMLLIYTLNLHVSIKCQCSTGQGMKRTIQTIRRASLTKPWKSKQICGYNNDIIPGQKHIIFFNQSEVICLWYKQVVNKSCYSNITTAVYRRNKIRPKSLW